MRGISETGPVINQEPYQIQNEISIKEVWVLVLGFLMFLSAASPGFSLVLNLAVDWEGKLRVLVKEEFEDNKGCIIWLMFLTVLMPAHVGFFFSCWPLYSRLS